MGVKKPRLSGAGNPLLSRAFEHLNGFCALFGMVVKLASVGCSIQPHWFISAKKAYEFTAFAMALFLQVTAVKTNIRTCNEKNNHFIDGWPALWLRHTW